MAQNNVLLGAQNSILGQGATYPNPYANQMYEHRPTFKILKIENGWIIYFCASTGSLESQYFVADVADIGPRITAILVEKCLEKK